MAAETIVLDIQFNTNDVKAAAAAVTDLNTAKNQLLATNAQLADQEKQSSVEFQKNAQQIKAINAEITSNSRVLQANTQAVKANADSIDGLKARNKELLKERNATSTATEEGRAKIEKLNAEYDKNSKIIAANSTQVEKQRFNIGNYQSALDGIAPGLSKMSQGLTAAATGTDKLSAGSKAFIATGIGAVIAAVGLALGALMKYFQGSEEGQNRLNKIMAVGSAIMEQFMNVVEDLGEAIYNAINNPQQAIKAFGALIKENIINRFEGMMELIPAIGRAVNLLFEGEFAEAGKVAFDAVAKVTTGIEDASGKLKGLIDSTTELVNQGIANGEKLAAFQAKIDKDERALVTERAKTALEVSKLRAQALELEGDARRKVLQEAIALEETLAKKEVELAKTRAERAALNVQANGDDKEALNELAAAQAAVIQAEAASFDNTLRFRKELEALNEADAKAAEDKAKKKSEEDKKAQDDALKAEEDRRKALEARNKEEEEYVRAAAEEALRIHDEYTQGLINNKKRELLEGKISQEEFNAEMQDVQLAALETEALIKREFAEEDKAMEGEILDYKIALGEKEIAIKRQQEKAKVDAVQQGLSVIASAFNKQSLAYKILASVQTTIDTIRGAVNIFFGMTEAIPGPVGIILGAAAAAAAAANGYAAVARINSTPVPKMAEGGIIPIEGKSHAQGGELVTIGGRPVAEVEGNENMVILKKGSTGLLRSLGHINKMVGGVDFYNDRVPRARLQDGGFVARSAGAQVSSFETQNLSQELKKLKLYVAVTEIRNEERNYAKVEGDRTLS